MKTITLKESALPQYVTQELNGMGISWSPADTEDVYKISFYSFVEFMRFNKKKESKVALTLSDERENLILAMTISYIPPTSEDEPGDWDLAVTTDPEDIKDAEVYPVYNNRFLYLFSKTAADFKMSFKAEQYVVKLIIVLYTRLLNWLDINTKEDSEEVELTLDGYFVAVGSLNNRGEKEFTILPAEDMKTLSKDESNK